MVVVVVVVVVAVVVPVAVAVVVVVVFVFIVGAGRFRDAPFFGSSNSSSKRSDFAVGSCHDKTRHRDDFSETCNQP